MPAVMLRESCLCVLLADVMLLFPQVHSQAMTLHCFCLLLHGLVVGALLCLLPSPGIPTFIPLFPRKVNWILWYHCTVWVLPCLVLSRTGGDTSHICLIHSHGHKFGEHWLQALYKAVFVVDLSLLILCLYSSSPEMFRELLVLRWCLFLNKMSCFHDILTRAT